MSYGQNGQLYDAHAAEYVQYRPTYPAELWERIFAFAGPSARDHALDVATGVILSAPALAPQQASLARSKF